MNQPTIWINTRFAQVMQNLRKPNYSPTCLLITHDMTMATFWDAVYRLKDGRLYRDDQRPFTRWRSQMVPGP